jgi:hypothetical protein
VALERGLQLTHPVLWAGDGGLGKKIRLGHGRSLRLQDGFSSNNALRDFHHADLFLGKPHDKLVFRAFAGRP